jgi:hypothetical protein
MKMNYESLTKENNMRKFDRWAVVVIVALTMLSLTAFAGNNSRIGTAGGQELVVPVGARGIGLGGSLIASATGVDAIYWNPAGLARMTSDGEAMFSQLSYIADIGASYGAVGIKAGSMGFLGISLKSVAFGDIPYTTEEYPDGTGQTYSPTFINLGFTYANLFSDRVSFGVTATLVSEKIMNTSASAIAFNGGIQYNDIGLDGLNFGVAIKNIGSDLTFDGSNLLVSAAPTDANRDATYYKSTVASAALPTSLELGLAYTAKLNETNSVLLNGQFLSNNYSMDEWKLGVEYSFDKTFFVRGGYAFAPNADKDATGKTSYQYDYSFGAGVNIDLQGTNLKVDYGYRHELLLDGNHAISLLIGF